ncbi:MAG: M20 metallopeptidase family protein [Christensenellales bacterium]
MRAFFEDLHRHPEPSHFENRTNRRVREQLKAHGIDMLCPKNNITIAVIHGAKPGKTVGLRFDTDALQLQELCDVPYKSEHDGLMHGCGHDAHTTCGVYVARLLKAHADELCGTYKIIFQPAEEGEHGADEVIATGLVSDVDAFSACTSGACIRPARCMPRQAASGPSRICSKSPSTAKAATAQAPEQCVDAITAGAAVVQSLQTIVSRFTSPMDSVVVTVGSFHAGTRCNIIAQDAVLEGTLRAFDDNVHARLIEHFKRIITDVSAAYGCTAEIDINEVTGVVVNDEALCQIARETAAELVPPEKIQKQEPCMLGDDFAAYRAIAPSCFVQVGMLAPEKNCCYAHHHGMFKVDEDVLPLCVAWMAANAERAARS